VEFCTFAALIIIER